MIAPRRARPAAGGFTLVELMIAMVLGLLLVGGAIQLLSSAQQSYRLQENVSRMQENGRFAVDLIGRDLRMAGFMQCGSAESLGVFNNIQGDGGQADPDFAFQPDTLIRAAQPAGAVPGTDALTLRHMRDQRLRVVEVGEGQGQNSGANIKVAGNVLGLQQGDAVAVTNCRDADIFRITNNPQQNPDETVVVTLAHAANFNLSPHLNGSYGEGDFLLAIRNITWFVGDTGRRYDDGVPVLALYRDVGTGPEEIIQGVEDLRLHYGVDDNGDRAADRYVDSSEVIDWARVVSVRASLLLQSHDNNLLDRPQSVLYVNTMLPADTRRVRRVFTTTVALRNRGGGRS